MSIVTTKATAVTTPSNKRLQRLAVAAGSYLGKDAGDSIPVEEVRLQAEANGYTEQETQAMLEADGFASTDRIQVPEQGLLFGELWAPSSSGVPTPSTPNGTTSERLETFREWCRERAESEASHSYTRKRANRRFAKAKDVDRHFIKEYDTFSTVLITYDAGVPVDESVAEHAERFYPRPVRRKRTAILKELNVLDSYAGVTLRAPKKQTEYHRQIPRTHTRILFCGYRVRSRQRTSILCLRGISNTSKVPQMATIHLMRQ
ncbi:hypothetical protein [Haloferax volcanii]|uniref:hypothetical protein n=1 Tax=Haloferax volcanii TaxID=2246 RepID=UPI00385E850E